MGPEDNPADDVQPTKEEWETANERAVKWNKEQTEYLKQRLAESADRGAAQARADAAANDPEAIRAERDKRLDEAGVTVDPESPHKAEGCRVGGRLDELIARPLAVFAEMQKVTAECDRLRALINCPHNDDWFEGVRIEAAFQQERFGTTHDSGKGPEDWFWLVGFLAGKALRAAINGNADKAKHHTISTAAVLLNWYRRISGQPGDMRPGIAPPAGLGAAEGRPT